MQWLVTKYENKVWVYGDACKRADVTVVLESWSLRKACCSRSQLLGSIYALLMVHISASGTNAKLLVEVTKRFNRNCFIDQVDLCTSETQGATVDPFGTLLWVSTGTGKHSV